MTVQPLHLREVSPGVFESDDPVVRVGWPEIEFLRSRVNESPRGRVRLCAHRGSGQALHEMLILLRQDSYIRPHRHLGKCESFHIVEGEVDVVLFAEDGKIDEVVQLGDASSGRSFYYRLADPVFHTLVIRTPLLIVHETTNGPFHREETEFAPWTPEEDDAPGQRAYIAEVERRIIGAAFTASNQKG